MPYEGEFAEYRSLRRLVENRRVQELLGQRMKVRDYDSGEPSVPLHKVPLSDLEPGFWQPDLLLAVDGSNSVVEVENGYPGAEVGYVTVAAVLINLRKIKKLDEHRPVDPKQYRTVEDVASIDSVFPGCNVVLDDLASPKESLRRGLFDTLASIRLPSDGEALLDTYEALLGYRQVYDQRCPYRDDCLNKGEAFTPGRGEYGCGCLHNRPMYSTDALRIHEGMVPDSQNGEMFGEIRQTLEHLIVLHILRWMEKTQRLWLLRHTAIIVDGPLAFFGNPSTLLRGYIEELRRINLAAKAVNGGQDILLMGVEKGGIFISHFAQLDEYRDGSSGAYEKQVVGLPTDEYIKNNIIFSQSSKVYGKETYFGRKLFYKTASGARIVASLPFLSESMEDVHDSSPELYPRLGDALRLLDQLISNRYPNAIFPLISANAEAAIPMNLGSRALEELTKKLIKSSM